MHSNQQSEEMGDGPPTPDWGKIRSGYWGNQLPFSNGKAYSVQLCCLTPEQHSRRKKWPLHTGMYLPLLTRPAPCEKKRTQHKGEKFWTNNKTTVLLLLGFNLGTNLTSNIMGEYDEQDFESAGQVYCTIQSTVMVSRRRRCNAMLSNGSSLSPRYSQTYCFHFPFFHFHIKASKDNYLQMYA